MGHFNHEVRDVAVSRAAKTPSNAMRRSVGASTLDVSHARRTAKDMRKKESMTTKIAPCLWFDGNAEEAAEFYARTFPESRVDAITRSPADFPGGREGDVLTVEFTVLGMPFVALNGGPQFTFDEAVSFQVYTEDQSETDRYWHAIIDDGGSEGDCGWCTDRFGLSWQIVPRALMDALKSPDRAAGKRAMDAMMKMKKIEIAEIDAALAASKSGIEPG